MNISCRELCSILLIHSSQLQEFFPRLCMYNLCFYMISSSSLYLYSGYYSTYWWDLETYFLVLAHLSCDGKHVLWYLSNSIISSIKYICWRSPWSLWPVLKFQNSKHFWAPEKKVHCVLLFICLSVLLFPLWVVHIIKIVFMN